MLCPRQEQKGERKVIRMGTMPTSHGNLLQSLHPIVGVCEVQLQCLLLLPQKSLEKVHKASPNAVFNDLWTVTVSEFLSLGKVPDKDFVGHCCELRQWETLST